MKSGKSGVGLVRLVETEVRRGMPPIRGRLGLAPAPPPRLLLLHLPTMEQTAVCPQSEQVVPRQEKGSPGGGRGVLTEQLLQLSRLYHEEVEPDAYPEQGHHQAEVHRRLPEGRIGVGSRLARASPAR